MRSAAVLFAAVAVATCARTAHEPRPAQPSPVAAPASRPWAEDIARFEAADRVAPPRPDGVLFVGSSSIRLWPALQSDFPGADVVQRGFGGSELAEVVHYAPRIVLPYRPRLIVLYAGENDLSAGTSPDVVFRRYVEFVALVHRALPATRIAFISLKPSTSRWALAEQMRAVNAMVQRHAATDPRLLYVDVFSPMLGPDGMPREELFVADRLHMNARGYAIWRDLLAPIVREAAR